MPQGQYRLADAQPIGQFKLADATPAAATSTYQPSNVLAEGRRSAAAGVKDDADPGAIATWFETTVRPALERVAHPQTVADIAALLVPEGGALAQGARATAADVDRVTANIGRAIAKLPTPTGQQLLTVLKTVRHPVREGLKAVADQLIARLEPAAAAEAPVVGRVVGKAPTVNDAVIDALNQLRQAPPAAEAARLPEYPQAAADTMRRLQERPPVAARAAPIAETVAPAPVVAEAAPITPVASHPRNLPSNDITPAAAPAAAGPFNVNAGLRAARDAFQAAGETPRPAEVTNAMELIRRGRSAEEAVAQIVSKRTPAARTAAEILAERFQLPTDRQVAELVRARNAQTRGSR